nr:MAG TPA: hypothetical protein [Caudoviricetes sp.]
MNDTTSLLKRQAERLRRFESFCFRKTGSYRSGKRDRL